MWGHSIADVPAQHFPDGLALAHLAAAVDFAAAAAAAAAGLGDEGWGTAELVDAAAGGLLVVALAFARALGLPVLRVLDEGGGHGRVQP